VATTQRATINTKLGNNYQINSALKMMAMIGIQKMIDIVAAISNALLALLKILDSVYLFMITFFH